MGDNALGKEAKGKGKAKAEAEVADEQQEEGNATLSLSLSRIAKSASLLPSALLGGHPGVSEVPRLGASDKGETSRSGTGLRRTAESAVRLRLSPSGGPSGGDAIKPRQTQEHIAGEEASFAAFLDSTAIDQPSTISESQGAWESNVPLAQLSARSGGASQSIAEQEARDGGDVVALLSWDSEPELDYGLGSAVSDGDLSNLRRALFDEVSSSNTPPVAWDNVLNFIPRYILEAANTVSGTVSGAAAGNLAMHVGSVESGEAWEAWMGQWSRVLTGYQDEVWGDLGSLMEEARAEVRRFEEAKPDERQPQPTALLRLRAILGHLRGTSSVA